MVVKVEVSILLAIKTNKFLSVEASNIEEATIKFKTKQL